jgi:hypothetical protein
MGKHIGNQKLEYANIRDGKDATDREDFGTLECLTELTLIDCDGSRETGSLLGDVVSCPTSGWLFMEVRSSSSFSRSAKGGRPEREGLPWTEVWGIDGRA